MSAQYRPYRDEESVDGIDATWSDNEPGSIQIYEKTTEELPFNSNQNRPLWTQIALFATVGLLGFCLGFFAPFHPDPIVFNNNGNSTNGSFAPMSPSSLPSSSSIGNETKNALEFLFHQEDSTIKDKLLSRIKGDNIMKLFKEYDNTDRIPGSRQERKLAQYVESVFREQNFDHIKNRNLNFKTMLPDKVTLVSVLNKDGKTIYSNLDNEKYPHDQIRPFLPLSQANATIITTDELLYANKGSKDDLKKLIDLSRNETLGRVIVIRQTFHQVHDIVIEVQELGAKAILLFPDPEIYGDKSAFPESFQLPHDAAKAHPIAWNDYGDLMGYNSSNLSLQGIDVQKLGMDRDVKVQIPVIPISFNTAKQVLRGLSGQLAPNDWNCFDFTLYVGPGYRGDDLERRDKLHIDFSNVETTVETQIVTGGIKGATEPDRYVIIGSRRDSLNRGLLDSVSGTAVMLEVARAYGSLLKEGWRPKRTIIFKSFGAESLNLVTSTMWLEQYQRLFQTRALAYINCDLLVVGNKAASIAASPLLYQVIYNSTKQVPDPSSRVKSVYHQWLDTSPANAEALPENSLPTEKETAHLANTSHNDSSDADDQDSLGGPGTILAEYRKTAFVDHRPQFRRLDLHSIYSPFFLFGGIPVADIRYAGIKGMASPGVSLDTNPIIGTKYDNLEFVQKLDPEMRHHVAVAQTIAEILRDLTDSAIIPFNLIDYGKTMLSSFDNLLKHYGNSSLQAETRTEICK